MSARRPRRASASPRGSLLAQRCTQIEAEVQRRVRPACEDDVPFLVEDDLSSLAADNAAVRRSDAEGKPDDGEGAFLEVLDLGPPVLLDEHRLGIQVRKGRVEMQVEGDPGGVTFLVEQCRAMTVEREGDLQRERAAL